MRLQTQLVVVLTIAAAVMLCGCPTTSDSDSPLAGKWVQKSGKETHTLEFLSPNLFKFHKGGEIGQLIVGPTDVSGEYKIIDQTHLRLDTYGGHPDVISYSLQGDELTIRLPINGAAQNYTRGRD